ncbi:MAG TPA: septal ring lytic transglycosylase RlpA family protein [Candidatus Limnocylindrales bacterium]|nr:septal ring lytic transglycosylase RlpA family protein [Candidatus Limnocylindrales bacterium]
MRPDRVLAGFALTAILALVAVPGTVGRQARPTHVSIDRLAPVVVDGAAETATLPDPATASAAQLEPLDLLVEPGSALPVRARPRAPLARASADAIARGGTGTGAGAAGSWHSAGSSWYGPGFYGSGTACGQTYTKTIIGVAHRTLPCGTLVEFRNAKNGKVVRARVIDRGPYVAGRSWDLSRGLCEALDHCYTAPIQWRLP